MPHAFFHRYLRVPYILYTREFQACRHPKATIVLLHGINSSLEVWTPFIESLPPDTRVIGIDLLGFGDSPRTSWPAYDVSFQAKCLMLTLLSKGASTPVIVVGHSLGSLVSIEFARRYKLSVKQLVLVSPPLFDTGTSSHRAPYHPEYFLREIYDAMSLRPERVAKLLGHARQYKLINHGFDAEKIDVPTMLGTLHAAVLNQTSLRDVARLKLPILLLTGKFDPFVREQTIRHLVQQRPNITHQSILGGHEMIGLMKPAVIKALETAVSSATLKQSARSEQE